MYGRNLLGAECMWGNLEGAECMVRDSGGCGVYRGILEDAGHIVGDCGG